MKKFLGKTVYTAIQERLKFVFDEFDNIMVAHSGGKDSGLLLELVLDYRRKIGDKRKIVVFHQDFEAQYQETTNYVTRVFEKNKSNIEPFWVCLPMATRAAISNYQTMWYPWDSNKREQWTRPLPKFKYVINENNHTFDFYKPTMGQEDFYKKFLSWFHHGKTGKTIQLLGLRTDESLNRFRAYSNSSKKTASGHKWTTKLEENLFVGYPLYDWNVGDVWKANYKFSYDYNKLYDLLFKVGVSPSKMRVSSPFHESAKHDLNLYRVIDPVMWSKLCCRVTGANFAAKYGETKALGYRKVTLPEGHTWFSYLQFLLQTLPSPLADSYQKKFTKSIKFWKNQGGVLGTNTLNELKALKIDFTVKGKTNYKSSKEAVTFDVYPDVADVKDFKSVPSYKRMCFCILKNDHLCKFMGFTATKKDIARRKELVKKYGNI